jgi:hypothetical protein
MADREGPVGVRLPSELKAALTRDAERNHRSLHGEIVARLAGSGLTADAELFGDSAPDADYNRAFGDAVARLAFEADRWNVGGPTPRRFDAFTSAVVSAAVTELLEAIAPTRALSSADRTKAEEAGRNEGRRLVAELRRSLAAEPSAGGFPAAIKTQAFMADLARRLGFEGGLE